MPIISCPHCGLALHLVLHGKGAQIKGVPRGPAFIRNPEKKCEECGRLFFFRRRNAKYCSSNCNYKAWARRAKQPSYWLGKVDLTKYEVDMAKRIRLPGA